MGGSGYRCRRRGRLTRKVASYLILSNRFSVVTFQRVRLVRALLGFVTGRYSVIVFVRAAKCHGVAYLYVPFRNTRYYHVFRLASFHGEGLFFFSIFIYINGYRLSSVIRFHVHLFLYLRVSFVVFSIYKGHNYTLTIYRLHASGLVCLYGHMSMFHDFFFVRKGNGL